ncbi:MAG: prephenate dehydratase [Methanothrix sp.]|uniref:prephenate dehydratase n=1 Tax=Methanothrix sp. TaxID=90426 RepID=UPI003C71738A
MRVGVLGPRGSYSEMAASSRFPDAELVYYDDIEDIFDAVESHKADAGVVPLENSLEGSVALTLDLLLRRSLFICGEVVIPIRHSLLGRGDPDNIRIILSHPQALAQCRQYIRRRYPGVEVRTTGSTSHAARLAQEFPEMAAIANMEAARTYGLKVLDSDIQDSKNNVTRFVVLSRKMSMRTGDDRTSIVVYLEKDRPGALFSILREFAIRNINLTRIESRPSRRELGDYYFFIDLEGHIEDGAVRESLEAIEKAANMVRVLGSYPKDQVILK